MRNLLCVLFILLGLSATAQFSEAASSYACRSGDSEVDSILLEKIAGLAWSPWAMTKHTEASARNAILESCKSANPVRSRFTNYCVDLAAQAECTPVEIFVCDFNAFLYDRYQRPNGDGVQHLSSGGFQIPQGTGRSNEQIARSWFEDFCPIAVKRALLGFASAQVKSVEEFCQEAKESLDCGPSL